jgi:hypothetical protein
VTIKNINTIAKEVITINNNVRIYKYPTILRYQDNVLTIGTLARNVKVTSIATYPINIDGKTFYIYESNGTIGFIYSADVVINTSEIDYLPTTNAKINIIDKTDYVNVYASNSSESEILDTLLNGRRISVTDFDKDSKYTYITYVDDHQVTHHGYVKTENIKLDGVDSHTITLVIMIVVTLIIFTLLIITFASIKRKRKI